MSRVSCSGSPSHDLAKEGWPPFFAEEGSVDSQSQIVHSEETPRFIDTRRAVRFPSALVRCIIRLTQLPPVSPAEFPGVDGSTG